MAEAKSHRERAERAAVKMSLAPENYAAIIARETFPAELVQAAKEVLAEAEVAGWSGPLCNLESALALYPDPEQETPE